MAKNYFQKGRVKFQPNEEASEEVEKLSFAIKTLQDANQPVPSSMLEDLAKLKRANSGTNKVNATKLVYNGVEYDSRREAHLAKSLTESGIQFDHQVQVELMEGFKLNGETIRPITIVVDFLVAGEFFIDVKGIEMEVFKIKWKLLKNKLRDTKKYITIHKDSEIQGLVALIKREQWQNGL